jgi:hypothetical protein
MGRKSNKKKLVLKVDNTIKTERQPEAQRIANMERLRGNSYGGHTGGEARIRTRRAQDARAIRESF